MNLSFGVSDAATFAFSRFSGFGGKFNPQTAKLLKGIVTATTAIT